MNHSCSNAIIIPPHKCCFPVRSAHRWRDPWRQQRGRGLIRLRRGCENRRVTLRKPPTTMCIVHAHSDSFIAHVIISVRTQPTICALLASPLYFVCLQVHDVLCSIICTRWKLCVINCAKLLNMNIKSTVQSLFQRITRIVAISRGEGICHFLMRFASLEFHSLCYIRFKLWWWSLTIHIHGRRTLLKDDIAPR